ncbi:TonB-dependent receptor domain-containing protein [Phenylobacterium terrae]|uniref:TonB-dependent receptor domain-containing protein n=1 Tax=Phenylobacterium terrae TaxID=2665495 RepID=A0ABW4MWU1_9CAUL
MLAASASALLAGGAAAQTPGAGHEVAEVVVEATPLGHTINEVATPVAQLAGDELVQRRQATLGETLQGLPGVNSDTFGGGASRPVIRGQTAPRVKVLSDSSELMDASAVSPDHAVTTEPLLLREIEVLRGPSALLYGGGAISGAVNLIDSKIPTQAPARGVEGVAEVRGGTNADERAAVFGLTVGGSGFALHAEAVGRSSDDYKVPDWDEDRVHGTFNDTSTVSFGGSWIGERGYLGAAFTRQRSEYGLPGHSHDYESCHPHGSSLHCGGHGHDDDDHDHDHGHEDEDAPFVRLRSERWDIRGEYREPFAGVERIRLRAGVTDYRHDEVEGFTPATTFRNDGYDARVEVEHKPVAGFSGVIGVQTAVSDFSALGAEAFLPASETRTTGLFLFEELDWRDWHFEFAARKDWQEIEGARIVRTEHDPFSLSASALWTFAPGYSAALAISRSQRAPTAQELYARGVHLATNTYEIGDRNLDEETANTVDLTFRKTEGDTTFTVGLFHHRIEDYIFAATLDRFEDFRLIRYTQQDARFTGIDGELTHRFTPALSATVFGDYVRAELTGGGGDVPRIPAGRLGGRVNGAYGGFTGELEYYRVFDQDEVADFEQETPGYDMVNATVAYSLPVTEGRMQVYVRGTNLLDELALNHASFVSRAAPLPGRTVVLGLRASF